jgi:hypothetical protein
MRSTRLAAVPATFRSIAEVTRAYADGALDEDGFVAAAVAIPVVRQNPMPDREWFDDWPQIDGPLSELQDALSRNLIPPHLYDAALAAMAKAGHDA